MPATDGSTRVTPVWLLALAFALLAARVTLGVIDALHPSQRPVLVRFQDPRGAEAQARSRGLPLLFVFVKDEQAESRALEDQVFADPRFAPRINDGFVAVRSVETAGGTRVQIGGDRATRYGISRRPALVAVNPSNDRHVTLTGFPGQGPVMQWLARAPIQIGMAGGMGGSLPFPGSPGDTLTGAPVDSVLR